MSGWLQVRQRFLGALGLIFLVTFVSFVTPLSLDMYTPALPGMMAVFDADAATVNLTLVWFYVVFAAGQLLLGPVSDRMGRRRLFLLGSLVYAGGSAWCAVAGDIAVLVAARMVEAVGAGALSAVSMAMVKDSFVPERRDAVLAVVQALFAVGPIAAPVLGAFVLQMVDWRMLFWVLAAFGLACFALGLLLEETLPPGERAQAGGAGIVGSLVGALRNAGFVLFLLVAALFSLPFMSYVSVASHAYITQFGQTELQYSVYFAVAMAVMAVGPFVWLVASRFMTARTFTGILIAAGGAAGVLLVATGSASPPAFCTLMCGYVLLEACVRPYTANILMSQEGIDAGTAASLVNFSHTALGTLGMVAATLPWPNYVVGLGVIVVLAMAAALGLWVALLRAPSVFLEGIRPSSRSSR